MYMTHLFAEERALLLLERPTKWPTTYLDADAMSTIFSNLKYSPM